MHSTDGRMCRRILQPSAPMLGSRRTRYHARMQALHGDVSTGSPATIQDQERVVPGPAAWLATACIAGLLLGRWMPSAALWIALSLSLLILLAWLLRSRRQRLITAAALAAAGALAAGWYVVRVEHAPAHHITRFLHADARQLVTLTGRVDSPPRMSTTPDGALAQFSYDPPATFFLLDVHTIEWRGEAEPSGGKLLVKLQEADHRVTEGAVIELNGWLHAFRPPMNPGEEDYRRIMAQRGIFGRLSVSSRDGWRMIDPPDANWLARGRRWIASQATHSLHRGMDRSLPSGHQSQADRRQAEQRAAFLDTVLLGRRHSATRELHESFKRIGLAHLLSISGAHLGILMAIIWCIVRLFVASPSRAAMILLAVLALYLAAVPLRTPIVRAGIMAGLLFLGQMSGRHVRSIDLVALAAVIVLLWKPDDLFTPGFQLSFGVVAALLLYMKPVSQWLWPTPLDYPTQQHLRIVLTRRGVDYVAVNLVAFMVAMPVVAYHFQIVSPLTVLLSVLSLPVITITLGLGYLKIVLGLIVPSAGVLLAYPLSWIADGMISLAHHAAHWPGAAVVLPRQPTLVWTITTLVVVVTILHGAMARRRLPAAAAVGLCIGWLAVAQYSRPADPPFDSDLLRINTFAVGDGSCHLIRIPDAGREPYTLLYDCGSGGYWSVGGRTIAPALKRLGVSRIDTLVISHPDIDHYNGCLDLVDAVPVGRVMVNAQMWHEPNEDSAPRALLDGLAQRGIDVQRMSTGWRESHGGVAIEAVWPQNDASEDLPTNDHSIVLKLHTPDGSLLLCGDIQDDAMRPLLEAHRAGRIDLRADIWQLPHHGDFVATTREFFEAVKPRVLVQSSGRGAKHREEWRRLLSGHPEVRHLVTADGGMIEITIKRGGDIHHRQFLDER